MAKTPARPARKRIRQVGKSRSTQIPKRQAPSKLLRRDRNPRIAKVASTKGRAEERSEHYLILRLVGLKPADGQGEKCKIMQHASISPS